MTKRDLVLLITERLSIEHQLTQRQVGAVIDELFREIAEALLRGETLEFRNFGVFSVRTRKGSIGRNPKKPEQVIVIPPHRSIRFKPGKELKKRLLLPTPPR